MISTLAIAMIAAHPSVLIFGGGWAPEGTPVSLETHVLAARRALAPNQPTLLFADGRAGTRSVQVSARSDHDSQTLAVVFDRPHHLAVHYRRTQVAPAGPATRARVVAWLKKAPNQPKLIIGVGHGRPAENGATEALELWGAPADALHVEDLEEALRDQTAPVAVALGHCFSGGFAAISRPDMVLARGDRCVFAAAPKDREASGCTPDANDPSARAYVGLLAEAFGTQTADYNGDHRISVAEAHSYAILADRTVNLPVQSLELWLQTQVPEPARSKGKIPAALEAVIRTLRPEVGAADDVALNGLVEDKKAQLIALEEERNTARIRLRDHVVARWPELANLLHPTSRRLLHTRAASVAQYARSSSQFGALTRIDNEIQRHGEEMESLERRWVRVERLRRAERMAHRWRSIQRQGTPTQRRVMAAFQSCGAMSPKVQPAQ